MRPVTQAVRPTAGTTVLSDSSRFQVRWDPIPSNEQSQQRTGGQCLKKISLCYDDNIHAMHIVEWTGKRTF